MNVSFAVRTSRAAPLRVAVENDFDFLADVYRRLYDVSIATSFQRPLWLHHVYRDLLPALGAKPLVITVRDGAGGLVAVLPLATLQTPGLCIAQPADFGVSDYNAVVCSETELARLVADRAVRAGIRRLIGGADALFFRKVRSHVDAIATLFGASSVQPNEQCAHELQLDDAAFDDWERRHLKRTFRKGLHRHRKRLVSAHAAVEYRYLEEPEEIRAAFAMIRRLRTARFADDILHQDAYYDFYLAYALAAVAAGEAAAFGIRVDGELIAVDFGIADGRNFNSILCAARIAEFGEYAPGLQSMSGLIAARHACGDRGFGFGIGDARYKRDFGARPVPLDNVVVANSLRGRLATAVYHHMKPVKNLLRDTVVRVR